MKFGILSFPSNLSENPQACVSLSRISHQSSLPKSAFSHLFVRVSGFSALSTPCFCAAMRMHEFLSILSRLYALQLRKLSLQRENSLLQRLSSALAAPLEISALFPRTFSWFSIYITLNTNNIKTLWNCLKTNKIIAKDKWINAMHQYVFFI